MNKQDLRRKSPSSATGNCISDLCENQRMSAKKVLKMVKAEEALHTYEKIPILKGFIYKRTDR